MSPHGTITRYTYHACRCPECRAANTASMRMYRERNPDVRTKQAFQRNRRLRALSKLGARHPEEYRRLLAEEPL